MGDLYPIANTIRTDRRADVVFVHGLGGDAFTTWRHGKDESTSWPHWLGEEFSDVGVWSLGYAASPSWWSRVNPLSKNPDAGYSMPLPDRGRQSLERMLQKGVGERPTIFVAHSLGGLLVKQILRSAKDRTGDAQRQTFFGNTRAVLFLGTPHSGAALASRLLRFKWVLGLTVSIDDLRQHDAHLRDLGEWYRANTEYSHVHTGAYFENRGYWGVKIVDQTTAHPLVGDAPVGLDENHLSLAKPRRRDAQVCLAVRDLLGRSAKPTASESVNAPVVPPSAPAAPVPIVVHVSTGEKRSRRIPRQLPPRATAEEFFGRKTELTKLTERLLRGQRSAVVGPAGFGKTALAAEAVRAVVGESDATLASSPFPDGVVFLDVYGAKAQAPAFWNALADAFVGQEMVDLPAKRRAQLACADLRALVVVEGAEQADGQEGRARLPDLLEVLSPSNCLLILTRDILQTNIVETIKVTEVLSPDDAGSLLDRFTNGQLASATREGLLTLLEGHPLALTWAGGLLASDVEDPAQLVKDWSEAALPGLIEPGNAKRTLQWLYGRSVEGLSDATRTVLGGAALLAYDRFPLAAIIAVTENEEGARTALKQLVQRELVRRSSGTTDHWQFVHVLAYKFARSASEVDPDLFERLAAWLDEALRNSLQVGLDDAAISPVLWLHAEGMLQMDHEQRLWKPMVANIVYRFSDRLQELGRLQLAEFGLRVVRHWFDDFPRDKADEPFWQREHGVSYNRVGDIQSAQGHLEEAAASFEKGLKLAAGLVAVDPKNEQWLRDLSVSFNKVGDVHRAQGNWAEALTNYEEGHKVFTALAVSNPESATRQRDVAASLNQVGDVYLKQKQLEKATTNFKEAHDILVRLVKADSHNGPLQRDLSRSFSRLGDLELAKNNLAQAVYNHEQGRQMSTALAISDPTNSLWQRDLSFSLTKLADLAELTGETAEALQFAEASLAIDERLSAFDPTNATWQQDVRISRAQVTRLRDKLNAE